MVSFPTLLSFARVPGGVASVQWRLSFSEPVTNLRQSDFTLAGDGVYLSGASIASVAAESDGTTWLLSVLPGAGEGRIVPNFTGSTVRDLDGNPLPGRFTAKEPVVVPSHLPLVILDANRDGRLDIATGAELRLGLGNGGFAAPTALAGGLPGGVPLAMDGNGDGRLDLVVAGASGGVFLAGQANGGFAPGVALALGNDVTGLRAADINGDGMPDVVAVAGSAIRVALQAASGLQAATTTQAQPSLNGGIGIGDVDGDGRADLAVMNGDLIAFWHGQPDGTLRPGATYAAGLNRSGAFLADLNGDGRLDLLTTGLNVSVRLGNGLGGFAERIESAVPVSSLFRPSFGSFGPLPPQERAMPVNVIRDITGDGVPDLFGIAFNEMFFFGTYHVAETFLARGRGDGTFETPVSLGTGTTQFRAYEDFDGDGRVDLLTARLPATHSSASPTPALQLSLSEVPPAYGDEASNFTPPRLLSITASTPDATVALGGLVTFHANFDRPVRLSGETFLRLDNGGVANITAGWNSNSIAFQYRAVEGEAAQHLEPVAFTGGFVAIDSGLPVDLGMSLPEVPGVLKVQTRTPLYFANADGRLAAWQFDGLQVFDKVLLSSSGGHSAAAILHVAGADLLLSGTGYIQGVSSLSPPSGGSSLGIAGGKWSFAGEGGSGGLAGRVFWHSTLGELVFWDTGGPSSPRAWLGQATLDWRVAAISDTTGDGAADVIFQNQDGRVALWQVQGNAVTRQAVIDIVTPDWRIVAAGDLNGDGRADLLYRNSADNRLVARFLDGFAGIGDNQVIGIASTDWSIADLRDMNGDGREDILWRNTSGDFAVWTMDGAQILDQRLFDKVSPDWQLLT